MPKAYPPGSIGAQLQAKGVPEDQWGEKVQEQRDTQARVNETEKARRKVERRGIKETASGIVNRNPKKLVSGVKALTQQQRYMNDILDLKNGPR